MVFLITGVFDYVGYIKKAGNDTKNYFIARVVLFASRHLFWY